MGAAAEIDKLSLTVEAEGRVFGEAGFDVLRLEFLIQVANEFDRLVAGQGEPLERFLLFDDRFHLGFDPGEVLLGNRVLEIEVIVEAVAGGRPNASPTPS